MRGLLDAALPELSSRGPRVAREFRPQEFLLIAVMAELETRLGVKRSYVVAIAKSLSEALSGPRASNREARLVVTFDPPSVRYSDDPNPSLDGIVMSLKAVFERVDPYVAALTVQPTQALRFAPMALQTRARTTSKSGGEASPLSRKAETMTSRRTKRGAHKGRRAGEAL